MSVTLKQMLVLSAANRTTISGTRAGALEALQQNTWVEFAFLTACHTAVGDTVLSLPTIQEFSILPRTGLFGSPSPARRVSFAFWNA
ncbi:uncharacterized protein F5891DRAFT_1183815 [Suillus fuscotomentosus]|uniref:CHAT domain-containing protein n=1 Tax=Suillus fuscotomentosus TaxID=1912939 RepID=A0AAD4EHK6_9AGAM|nr:uncharacterized protein F5891DRAFT_1183815 [Suillus fuscotomentosus]KAG1905103.1 hypothetical protein F5891DRAFT_1183815 [Suillus fuscotomentosus]